MHSPLELLNTQVQRNRAQEKAAWIAAIVAGLLCVGATSQESITPAIIGGVGYFILGGVACACRAGSDDGIREIQRMTGTSYHEKKN